MKIQRRAKRNFDQYMELGAHQPHRLSPGGRANVQANSSNAESDLKANSSNAVSDLDIHLNSQSGVGNSKYTDSNSDTAEHSTSSDDSCSVNNILNNRRSTCTDIESLQKWAINHQITHSALRDLIPLLNYQYNAQLPIDPRTLCNTPKNLSHKIKKIGTGEYFHFGVNKFLDDFLGRIHSFDVKTIYLAVNCDGIPLFRSSAKQLWPILAQFSTDLRNINMSCLYAIGIFLGDSKPCNINDYLQDFINEMLLLQNGIDYKGKSYNVYISFFCCDAPARQYLKSIISHNGYHGCERCMQVGKYVNSMTFSDLEASPRTDEFFLNRSSSHTNNSQSTLTIGCLFFIVSYTDDQIVYIFNAVSVYSLL